MKRAMNFYAIKDIKKNKLVSGIYSKDLRKYYAVCEDKPPILYITKDRAEFEILIRRLNKAKYKVVKVEVKEFDNE